MTESGTVTLRTVEGDGLRFEASFPQGNIIMDSGPGQVAPNPVQHLLAALAICEGMDVIHVLRKKRQQVTAYDIAMTGERATEHPRRLTRVELVHQFKGHDLQRAAVEEAMRLSAEKYCSVYHSLRPDLEITSRAEITEG
jgi:putative redox protein